jgi:alpha-beta hydrolase superfamily lysophospholipase
VTARDVTFYSEAVVCYGRLFLPSGFSASSKAAAVVLAPAAAETAATLERYGAALAANGIVAMAIDYRGWGRSGAFIYVADNVRWDDRLRFSQHTAKVRLRRRRLIPAAQVTDIRNAITWIQGEPGVDRARIGVWGADLGGGHAIMTAGTDARVKAVVVQVPIIEGKDVERRAWQPTAAEQATLIKLARTGQAPASAAAAAAMNDEEAKLALAEYRPFWYLQQIPQTTSVLFVVAEKDAKVNNENHAVAASKVLKGKTNVVTLPGATHSLSGSSADAAAKAAADWFSAHL